LRQTTTSKLLVYFSLQLFLLKISEQPSTPNKKRSCIYDFYTEDDEVEHKYICNICQLGVLAKGRTSNLIAHLQVTNHEKVYKKYLNANVERQNSVSLVKSMSKKRKIFEQEKQPSILSNLAYQQFNAQIKVLIIYNLFKIYLFNTKIVCIGFKIC
jgi:hypothetical protein